MKFSTPEEIKLQELDWKTKALNNLDVKRIIELLIISIFSLIIIFTFVQPVVIKLLKVVVPDVIEKKEKITHEHAQQVPMGGYPNYGPSYGPQPYGYGPYGPPPPPMQQQPIYQNIPQPQQVIIHQQAPQQNPQIIYADSGSEDVYTPSQSMKKKSNLSKKLDELDRDVDLDQVDGRVKSSSITRISNLVKRNPEETISLLRSWLYEEGDA